MSRKFDRASLPALQAAGGNFSGFADGDNKLRMVVIMLRKLIEKVRQDENTAFYSMREMAEFWGVPLRTVALAFEELESEGLLLRFRGSHTKVLGQKDASISHASGVVGIPVWLGGVSHYEHRRRFVRALGESLWKNRLVTDVVFYWHSEDFSSDFVKRLLHHQLDYMVWFQPFRRHLNIIESLRDHGIRTVSICDEELRFMPGQIGMNWKPAYSKILQHWAGPGKIRTIAIVEPPAYLASRLHPFEREAARHGLECLRLKSSGDIFRHSASLRARKSDVAYAFLDQYGPLEFVLRDPAAFIKSALRHRILFARDCPTIPFAVPEELRIDRITHPTRDIIEEVAGRLAQWRGGNFEETPATFEARAETGLVVAKSQELTSLVVAMGTADADV